MFRRVAPQLRLIAAGGLNPDNVAEAIRTLTPWGVDVATGVEAAPGRKDPARVAGLHPQRTGYLRPIGEVSASPRFATLRPTRYPRAQRQIAWKP